MNKHIKTITLVALFAALVLVSSKIEIRISDTRLHFGNAMCLLSGFILNPISAGLASGIGSLFFDILFYPSSFGFDFLITFINKFVMGFVCSLIYHKLHKINSSNTHSSDTQEHMNNNKIVSLILSGTLAEISYIILYISKTFIERYFIVGIKQIEVLIPILLVRIGASTVNAIFAIIVSIILYKSLEKYLNQFNI